MKILLFLVLTASTHLFALPQVEQRQSPAKTEILFWHAFEGFLYDQFAEIVSDFNHQSKAYQVTLVYKGNYTETFDRGVAAFEQGNPPHILQIYEVATQTMTLRPKMFRSVDDLMRHYFKKSAQYLCAL